MRARLIFMIFLLYAGTASSQTAEIEHSITITDGIETRTLRFGLDPAASNAINASLGEEKLPPVPPPGLFDARFVDLDLAFNFLGNGTYADFRPGGIGFVGTVAHEILIQDGEGSDPTLAWDLPKGTVVTLTDTFQGAILSRILFGSGSLSVPQGLGRMFFSVQYGAGNIPPVFESSPTALEVPIAGNFLYEVVATGGDGDAVGLQLIAAPAWLSLSGSGGNGSLTGSPGAADIGVHQVILEADDGTDETRQTFSITAYDPDDRTPDLAFLLLVSEGPSSQALSIGLDPTATPGIDSRLGEVKLPPFPPRGVFGARFVDHNLATSGLLTGSHSDYRTGDPRFISTHAHEIRMQRVSGPASIAYDLPTGVTITYASTGLAGGTVQGAGTIDIIPESITTVLLSVHYGAGDALPVFETRPSTAVIEANTFNYALRVTDADGDQLTLRTLQAPDWLTLGDNGDGTGQLTGTPDANDVGSHGVVLSADDGQGGIVEQAFSLSVLARRSVRDFGIEVSDGSSTRLLRFGLDPSATNGLDEGLGELGLPPFPLESSFDARFSDEKSPAVGFGLGTYADYRPGDASFEGTMTHEIEVRYPAGTPISMSWQLPPGVTGTLKDGFGGFLFSAPMTKSGVATVPTDLQEVVMQITYAVVHPPEFTSSPVETGLVGSAYAYAMTATDPDGDVLSFSIPTRPSWLFLSDNGNGTAALSGTPQASHEGSHAVVLAVTDGAFTVQQEFTVVVSGGSVTESVDIAIAQGWNMIALPGEVEDASADVLFPNRLSGALFAYAGSYVAPDPAVLVVGTAYWLRQETVETVSVEYTPDSHVTLQLAKGWNMVGGPSCDLPLAAVGDPQTILISGSLFAFRGGYKQSTGFSPSLGYWLRTSEAGTIELDCASAGKAETPNPLETLISVDFGIEGRLFLDPSGKISQPGAFPVPPADPSGRSLIAFDDGSYVSSRKRSNVLLAGADWPLQVTGLANGATVKMEVFAGASLLQSVVFPGPPITLNTPQATHLELSLVSQEELPGSFAIESAYPNPFNPRTSLGISLPESGDVSLEVFDLTGRKVRSLLQDSPLEAGRHNIVFDAATLSSGVYLIRLVSGARAATSHVVLLK